MIWTRSRWADIESDNNIKRWFGVRDVRAVV